MILRNGSNIIHHFSSFENARRPRKLTENPYSHWEVKKR